MVGKGFSSPHARYLMCVAAGAFLCGLANTPAVAQAASASPEAIEQIIVHGPYIVRREPLKRSKYGFMNQELISVSRAVSYEDLDLSKESGATELKKRISDTAKDVCKELNTEFPKSNLYVYENTDCVMSATKDAMTVANQVIAAVKK